MAERTISVGPLPLGATLDQLQTEFKGLGIERMALLAEQGNAYVQFSSVAEVQTLASRYPQCKVPQLANAEIGFVQEGFKWPTLHASARAECLVVVRGCERVGETSEARIRQIFKKFAIEKVARFEESGQVVLEFPSQDDLELIDMEFDNLKVPELGPKAQIDVDNAFPVERFLQRYLQRNQLRVVEENKKQEQKQTPPSPQPKQEILIDREEQRLRKEQESKRKIQEMQREIQEKERLRKSEKQALERAIREKQERQRIERFAREKKQREEKQRRELIEQQQKKREEAIRKAQEQQQRLKKQEKVRKQAERQEQLLEQKLLAQRIASIKLQVQAEESKIREKQREARQKITVPVQQREPELQHILNQQKQTRKKEIKLPQINISETKPTKTDDLMKQETKPVGQNSAENYFIVKDYSTISVHFITVVIVAWIYYILVR